MGAINSQQGEEGNYDIYTLHKIQIQLHCVGFSHKVQIRYIDVCDFNIKKQDESQQDKCFSNNCICFIIFDSTQFVNKHLEFEIIPYEIAIDPSNWPSVT